MKKFLGKLKNSISKRHQRAAGSLIGLLLTGVLISVGVPAHLAAPAGDIGAEIINETLIKGENADGSEAEI